MPTATRDSEKPVNQVRTVQQSEKKSKLSAFVATRNKIKLAAKTVKLGVALRDPLLAKELVSTLKGNYTTEETLKRVGTVEEFLTGYVGRFRKYSNEDLSESYKPYLAPYAALLKSNLNDNKMLERLTSGDLTSFSRGLTPDNVYCFLSTVNRLSGDGYKLLNRDTMLQLHQIVYATSNDYDGAVRSRYLAAITRENVDLLTDKDILTAASEFRSPYTVTSYLGMVARVGDKDKVLDRRLLDPYGGKADYKSGKTSWDVISIFDFVRDRRDLELFTNDVVIKGLKNVNLNGHDVRDFLQDCKENGTKNFEQWGLSKSGNDLKMEKEEEEYKEHRRKHAHDGLFIDRVGSPILDKEELEEKIKGIGAVNTTKAKMLIGEDFIHAVQVINSTPYRDRVEVINMYTGLPKKELKEFENFRQAVEELDRPKVMDYVKKMKEKQNTTEYLRFMFYQHTCWDLITSYKFAWMLTQTPSEA
jgi:hypothetical protein